MNNALPTVPVDNLIREIRGQKVIIDADLARLYEVETKRLNEQVKRKMERFPKDFMFQLSEDEFHVLKSHFAISSWGGRRFLPYVFTELDARLGKHDEIIVAIVNALKLLMEPPRPKKKEIGFKQS